MDPIDLDHGPGIWKFFLDLCKKECYLFIYFFNKNVYSLRYFGRYLFENPMSVFYDNEIFKKKWAFVEILENYFMKKEKKKVMIGALGSNHK